MNLIKYCLTIITLSITILASGQDIVDIPSPKKKNKEIGLNMTNFVSQFVPLGSSFPKGGPFSYTYKKYGNVSAFRFGLGMNLGLSSGEEDLMLHMRLGYEKRYKIAEKWAYTRGMDFAVMLGQWNIPGIKTASTEGSFGFGPVVGFEYYIFPNVYLSTESFIYFGLGFSDDSDGIFVFRILPPTALILNIKFSK